MITDEMIAEACGEVSQAMMKSLSGQMETEHIFSARFERKMKRLIRKVDHPVQYRIRQIAASVAVAILIGFATLMAASPAARAAVVGWVREQIEDWFSYSYAGETSTAAGSTVVTDEFVEYYISALPMEYDESNAYNIDRNKHTQVYISKKNGDKLIFYYSLSIAVKDLFIEDKCVKTDIDINGAMAQVYTSDSDEANIIVWIDENTNTLFYISAVLPQEELIALAKSVREK